MKRSMCLKPTAVVSSLESLRCDVLVVPVFSELSLPPEVRSFDKSIGGRLTSRLREVGFLADKLEFCWMDGGNGLSATRVLVVGLGKSEEFDSSVLRDAFGQAAKVALGARAKVVGIPLFSGGAVGKHFNAALEGFLLGSYRFFRYREEDAKKSPGFEKLVVACPSAALKSRLEKTIEPLTVRVNAVYFARDLINEPANEIHPDSFEKAATAVAKESKLGLKVFHEDELRRKGMNLILAVGMGSERKPRLVQLEYNPGKTKKTIVLVGKGVTFDSGGLSLKPQDHMYGMKVDMSGAAAVLAAMWAIGKLRPKVRVYGLMPLVENMPSGGSVRPGDIFVGYNGKSVEIENTDAEGRLILADALSHADSLSPTEVIDVATLTGACVVALGDDIAGVMSNDNALAKRIMATGTESGEKFWQLPLETSYRRLLQSDSASMKNTGGRYGGAITAALFLSEFTKCKSWAHLDIAGPASIAREWPTSPKGGTGFAVRTFLDLCS